MAVTQGAFGIPNPTAIVGAAFSGVKTYDPGLVNVIVGAFPLIGFAPNTIIKIQRNSPTYKMVVGVNGEVARIKTKDFTGNLEITLMQTSESNILLTTLQFLDEFTGVAPMPILIMDLGGMSTYVSATGWLTKPPESSLSKQAETRTWNFDLATLDIANLGNMSKPTVSWM